MNWLTIVLGALIVLAIITGYTRGLLSMLVGLAGYAISLLVAGRYATPLREWLQSAWHTTDRLAGTLEGHITLPREAYQVPAASLTYDRAMQLLKSVPLPQAYKEAMARQLTASAPPDVSLAHYLMHRLAEGMMEAACFLVIAMVVSYALIWVGQRVSFGVSKLPILGGVNRLLGAVVGGVEATVTLSVALGLLAPFLSMQLFTGLAGAVARSTLAQWFVSLYPVISRWLFGRAWLFFGL